MSNRIFSTVSVIGLGYIGLPTATMFASRRIRVVGVDVNPQTVETINRGQIHIVEPDLDIAVHSVVQQGYLRATTKPEAADAFLIAVPTPFNGKNHDPDLTYVEAASRAIAPVLQRGNLVVLESTSPVGTTEAMAKWLAEARPDLSFPQSHGEASDIRIAHCPERVLPGKVMQELVSNARVIGGMTRRCSEDAASLYRIFVSGECHIASSPRLAEMAKLTENSFRDVNIAFANELSLVCDKLNIDVWELIRLANRHPRVNILQPGPGVGGHCIAVDPWFIVSSAPDEAHLIRTAREVNDSKPHWVLAKIREAVDSHLMARGDAQSHDVAISVYGLAFKPNIDDLRESPAVEIALQIDQRFQGTLNIVEPYITTLPKSFVRAKLCSFADAGKADIHVMLVDHDIFKQQIVPSGSRIDTRGIWKTAEPPKNR
jgi:UDP-N-acetyl-D-mannosaminuronic acid dehydrogenase